MLAIRYQGMLLGLHNRGLVWIFVGLGLNKAPQVQLRDRIKKEV